VWQPGGPETPHQVAVSVDPSRYFEHFFNTFAPGISGAAGELPG
jgi:hypothetical protein